MPWGHTLVPEAFGFQYLKLPRGQTVGPTSTRVAGFYLFPAPSPRACARVGCESFAVFSPLARCQKNQPCATHLAKAQGQGTAVGSQKELRALDSFKVGTGVCGHRECQPLPTLHGANTPALNLQTPKTNGSGIRCGCQLLSLP